MTEKFGYTLSTKDNIKIYRAVGQMKIDKGGLSYFEPDFTKVPRTYKNQLTYKVFPATISWRTNNTRPATYDTRLDAENSAKEQLRNRLIARIEQAKKEMREAEALIDNMQSRIKFHDCGK